MKRLVSLSARCFWVVLLLCRAVNSANTEPSETLPGAELVTNVATLGRIASGEYEVNCGFSIEGVVLWESAGRDRLILQDDSRGILFQFNPTERPRLQTGQRVRVAGRGVAGKRRVRDVLIDNDGVHGVLEVAQAVYLPRGRCPLRAEWFNGPAGFDLSIEYQGPGLPRQRIPDSALSRRSSGESAGGGNSLPGLDYRCYEGAWQQLPDFSQLLPIKTGTANNFDLAVRSRDQNVGLQFDGWLDIPTAGVYSFWLRSDDGSRLYMGTAPLQVTMLGSGQVPQPVRAGKSRLPQDDCRWSEAEGVLLSLQPEPGGGLEGVLGFETYYLRLDIMDVSGKAPPLFSTIKVTGVAFGAADPEAGRFVGRFLVPSWAQVELIQPLTENVCSPKPTTLAKLRAQATSAYCDPGAVRLQGLVLEADPAAGLLVLDDQSSVALVQMDLRGWNVAPGQTITLEGNCVVSGPRVYFRQAALVNNDGVHNLAERSGAIYLTSGKHPLAVSWFNREPPGALEVYWQGPGLPRQRIPEEALCLPEPGPEGTIGWSPGLVYQASEGNWFTVPSSLGLEPVKHGISFNFDSTLATRTQYVGLNFGGYLDVPADGVYTFTTVSRDGSLLFVDSQPIRLQTVGSAPLPAPIPIAPRQILSPDQSFRWVTVEGRVTFVSERDGKLMLELNAGTGRMQVEVADPVGNVPLLLLNSRIQATGICELDYTTDGQAVAGTLIVPSLAELEYLEMSPVHWTDYQVTPISLLGAAGAKQNLGTIAHVRGRIVWKAADGSLVLEDATGQARLRTPQAPPESDSAEVEALGRLSGDTNNLVLERGFYRELSGPSDEAAVPAPLLTTIEQVKRLTRREANRSYPVKIRGIVTTELRGGCFMQDAAWAIYVRWQNTIEGDPPRIGEYWEVEGVTFAEFAPNIRARQAVRLGTGVLPEPLRPTWDQLINGSLDTRYVEIQGVVTGLEPDGLDLLTRDGRIRVQLIELTPENLKTYQNALIRIRGCLIPEKDVNARKVELGRIGLSNCSVNVDEPAPVDPFSAPLKRIGELLLFDPRASSIQRVKVSGQVLHQRHGEYFLVESGAGLRFFLRGRAGDGTSAITNADSLSPIKGGDSSPSLRPGDLVEVVGFPELGGPSPVLREAQVRRVGHGALPTAEPLAGDKLLGRQHDATMVRVEGRLASLNRDRAEQALELQAGGRGFVARLETRRGEVPGLAPGTLLELTGVYAGQGGDFASGRDIDSFELLLNSPRDLKILERPSWWTGRHALTVLVGMTVLILVALFWITLLRRQVEERSQLLATEVRRHEQTEQQRSLEQERARISRDLHDDLGATLTQIRLLSALESRAALLPESSRSRMGQISEQSRQMMASLDEIVWAVNPANDSLPSLATYLCQFAEEFFRPTNIRCRLDVAEPIPSLALTSEVRHNLYLAVREALNNIAKHSEATEVWLRIQSQDHNLRIDLEDNGRGFSFPAEAFAGDGLANMRGRLEAIGGKFECETRSGCGTICRIRLPLASSNGTPKSGI